MLQWVPVETGQPEDLRNYVSWEQTLCSDKAWPGIHLQQTTTAGGWRAARGLSATPSCLFARG